MKKIIAMMLAIALLFTLSACGTEQTSSAPSATTNQPTETISPSEPLAPYQVAETVPFTPTEIHDIVSAEIHESFGDFIITDKESLSWIEQHFGTADKLEGMTKCPFSMTIYLFREDGTVGTVMPAEDSCDIFLSDGICYDYNAGDNTDLFKIFGIEPNSKTVETTYEGEERIVTVRQLYWYQENDCTVYRYDSQNRLISSEQKNADGSYGNCRTYEYDEMGHCVKQTLYAGDSGLSGNPFYTLTYNYDLDGLGLISTVRNDADGYHEEFEFRGSEEYISVTDAAKAYIQDLPEKDTITDIESPFVIKVSWPDSGIYVPAENYSAEVEVENNLVYLLSYKTSSDFMLGSLIIYIDCQSNVIGLGYSD